MIIKNYEITKKNLDFLNFFLIHGENIGLNEDLTKYILEFKEKKNGKYKIFKFKESEILNDKNNIYNLIFSGSLFDKKKAIFVHIVTDKLFDLIKDIFEKENHDILIIFRAGQIEKKSKIRNLFEKEKSLVSVACYQDNNFELMKIIKNEIKLSKIKLSTESINLLIERAMGDRNNLKNEINKLKSFALNKDSISHEHVQTLTNLAKNYQNDYIVNTCLNGNKKRLKKTLNKNIFLTEDFFILLKILSKKIHRLLKIKIIHRSEKDLDKIFGQIKPPIFWKEKDDIKRQINLWNERKLNLIVNEINKIELSCKKNHELSIYIMLDFLSNVCEEVNNYS